LDHLSKGRLNLCFANGSVTADQELYGVDPKDRGRMVLEAIDVILDVWSRGPPYEHKGEFWQFELKKTVDYEGLIGFIHQPYQRPHPPIAMPGMSQNSFSMKLAGLRGYQPFAHCLVAGNVVADQWKTYAAAATEAGRTPDRSDFKVARSIFLADTTEEAVKRARKNSLGRNYEYIGGLFDKGLGRRIYKRDLDMPDSECRLDYVLTQPSIVRCVGVH